MSVLSTIKGWFKQKGGGLIAMKQKEHYERLIDHPRINIDPDELKRIEATFRDYRGQYPKVKELNVEHERIERDFRYLNMTKEVASHMATLSVNENCEIVIGQTNDDGELIENDMNKFWQSITADTDFVRNLAKYVEPALATGGLAVKPYWDSGSRRIEFSWCLADAFIPLRMNTNSISEAVIPSVTTEVVGNETYYYTLLEFHEWEQDLYVITNELYKRKEPNGLGERVPLHSLDAYKGLQGTYTIPNLTRPQFSYFKPAGFNNINPRSPLGLGLCDNAKPTIDGINLAYDKLWKEIDNSEAIKIVSDHFLRTRTDHNGRLVEYFNKTDTVFKALPSGGNMDDMVYKDLTTDLRIGSYTEAINKFIATLEFQAGLSGNTFVFDGAKGAVTATEVVSKDSKTYQTRNKHVQELREFIIDLVISTFELAKWVKADGRTLYSGDIPTREEIGVNFDDGVFESRSSELEFYTKAERYMPTIEIIQRLFNIPMAEAQKWIDMKNQEVYQTSNEYREMKAEKDLFGSQE